MKKKPIIIPKIEHSKSRLEGFSDSVFAFAATLLVVSLEVPKSITQLEDLQLGFISFASSFLALALLWSVHYNFFRRVKTIDGVIIALNMILLFVILFYVYPLKFLSNMSIGKSQIFTQEGLAFVFQLYGLGFVLIFAVVALMYKYASLPKHQQSNQILLQFHSRHYAIFVAVGLLSIALAKLMIGVQFGLPGFIFGLLGPLCYLHGKIGVNDQEL